MTHDNEAAWDHKLVADIVADISARLRRAFPNVPDDEFGTLVQDVTRVALRFREIDADPTLWRPISSAGAPLAPLPAGPRPEMSPPPGEP